MRLLLHHFLDEKDIRWLGKFTHTPLNDVQKQTLIFVREIGAIDNRTYRQMADNDISKASSELRYLRNQDLLSSKGKGKSTYYIAGSLLIEAISEVDPSSDGSGSIRDGGGSISDRGGSIDREELIKELPDKVK